jgi:flagellar basal body-associated protein FliL
MGLGLILVVVVVVMTMVMMGSIALFISYRGSTQNAR